MGIPEKWKLEDRLFNYVFEGSKSTFKKVSNKAQKFVVNHPFISGFVASLPIAYLANELFSLQYSSKLDLAQMLNLGEEKIAAAESAPQELGILTNLELIGMYTAGMWFYAQRKLTNKIKKVTKTISKKRTATELMQDYVVPGVIPGLLFSTVLASYGITLFNETLTNNPEAQLKLTEFAAYKMAYLSIASIPIFQGVRHLASTLPTFFKSTPIFPKNKKSKYLRYSFLEFASLRLPWMNKIPFVNKKKKEISANITKSIDKSDYDDPGTAFGILYLHEDNIDFYRILESSLLKTKIVQEEARGPYVNRFDLEKITNMMHKYQDVRASITLASTLMKDWPNIGNEILKRVESQYRNNLTVIGLTELVKSIHAIPNSEQNIQFLISEVSKLQNTQFFQGVEKSVIVGMDKQIGRVVKKSDYNLADQSNLDRKITKELSRSRHAISGELPLFATQIDEDYYSMSVLIPGMLATDALANTENQYSTISRIIKLTKTYQDIVNTTLQGSGENLDTLDIRETLLSRAYTGRQTDIGGRLPPNNYSDALISKISEYWERAVENVDVKINHGDLSTNNIILGSEVAFFDHRLKYAPQGFLDQPVFLSQPEIRITPEQKIEIMCNECRLDPEQASIALLATGLCELGAHMGQGKHYDLTKEFAELERYASKTSVQSEFIKYQKSVVE